MSDHSHRDFENEKFAPFALALGQMNLAWNDLHVSLARLFSALLKIPNLSVADTIWYSLKSDRAQRDLIQEMVRYPNLGYALPDQPKARVLSVLAETQNIAERRNDFIHSPFVLSGKEIVPLHLGRNKRGLNLSRRGDPLTEAKWFYKAAMVQRDNTDIIVDHLNKPYDTWPEKLPSPNRGEGTC